MTTKVIDFIEKRKESIEQKRRSFERIMFKNFLGTFTYVEDAGNMIPVEIVDISYDGCLFQFADGVTSMKKFQKGEEKKMKLYFTDTTYVPVVMKIKYSKDIKNGFGSTYFQFGCEFDKSLPSYKALYTFVDFLYKFAECSIEEKKQSKSNW